MTLETSQEDIFPLNVVALKNIFCIFVTELVSQVNATQPLLYASAPKKISRKEVTPLVSHELISWSNAFALVKILSNFFFARDKTKTPFYISSLIV